MMKARRTPLSPRSTNPCQVAAPGTQMSPGLAVPGAEPHHRGFRAQGEAELRGKGGGHGV
jgi:hypothetical protein